MRTASFVLGLMAACLPMTVGSAADVWGLERGTPELKSATTLAFGPEDILFVGDAKAATVYAIATGDREGDPGTARINLDNITGAIADVLSAAKVTINDLAVNPRTGNAFLAVSADDAAALVRVDGSGKLTAVSLTDVRFSRAELANAPPDAVVGEGRRARNNRSDSITDIAFFENKLLVSGLSAASAPSTVRELNFPFAAADTGVSVEIYHTAHGRDENYAAIRTFVPMTVDGEPSILGAYVCTPLVKIPLSELSKAGETVRGSTVAELGNRNQPLDMITYEKDGQTWLLLSNSARGVMKVSTSGLGANQGLTDRIPDGNTAGQPYETVEAMAGVVQMDKLNDDHALLIVQSEGSAPALKTVALP